MAILSGKRVAVQTLSCFSCMRSCTLAVPARLPYREHGVKKRTVAVIPAWPMLATDLEFSQTLYMQFFGTLLLETLNKSRHYRRARASTPSHQSKNKKLSA